MDFEHFISLTSDKLLFSKYSDVYNFIKKENIEINNLQLDSFITKFDTILKTYVNELSLLYYLIIANEPKWGNGDKAQLEINFIESKQALNDDLDPSDSINMTFKKSLDSFKKKIGFDSNDINFLRDIFFDYKCQIGKYSYAIKDIDFLNKMLKFFKLDKVIIKSQFDNYLIFFYCSVEVISLINNAYLIKKEWVRFPTVPLALAALNMNDYIYLRQESMDLIFEHKWRLDPNLDLFFLNKKEDRIANKLKHIYKYDIEEKEYTRDEVIDDMTENVLYHEIGHEASYRKLSCDMLGFFQQSEQLKLDVLYDIFEWLADVVKHDDAVYGLLPHILSVSVSDPVKATRLFYMYTSDTFFFDTNDKHLFGYSALIQCVMLHVIKPDHSIDFDLLKTLVDVDDPSSFYNQLFLLLSSKYNMLKHFIQKGIYIENSKVKPYFEIAKDIQRHIIEVNPYIDQYSFSYHSRFWSMMIPKLASSIFDKVGLNKRINEVNNDITYFFSEYFYNKKLSQDELISEIFNHYGQLNFYE